MAHIALLRGAEVILILTRRLNTIVAGRTRPEHLGMVDGDNRREDIGRVTVFAHIRRLDVRRILAGRIRAVMAAHTVARDIYVIEVRRQPANGAVAIVAIIATRNMCRVFAGRYDAIMTGTTTANDLSVIDYYNGNKHRGAVAVFADVRRLDVRWVLADCLSAVVAVDTIGGYQAVIECGRQPSRGRMTVITGVTARDMCRLFADSNDTVMASSASANDLGVVHCHHGCENIGCMAVLADVC